MGKKTKIKNSTSHGSYSLSPTEGATDEPSSVSFPCGVLNDIVTLEITGGLMSAGWGLH